MRIRGLDGSSERLSTLGLLFEVPGVLYNEESL
jgi:hypothetical protein